jgi:hypothetical protein
MAGAHPTDPTRLADLLDRADTCLAGWTELAECGRIDQLDDLVNAEEAAAALVEEAARVLEGLGVDPGPLLAWDMDRSPGHARIARLAIRRAAIKITSRPAHPTADFCLLTMFRVRWDGTTELEPLLWHLLDNLLRRDHYPVARAALEEAVWAGKGVVSKTVDNAISRLNVALLPIRFPWEWRVKAGIVYRDG